MAIAFDAAANGNFVNPGTNTTWSHTCTGSNGILIVGAELVANGNMTCTYNGVSMTRLTQTWDATLGFAAALFYLLNPATGTNTVSLSSDTSALLKGGSASYNGVAQSGQPDASTALAKQTDSGTNTTSVSVTTVADNCWVIGQFQSSSGYSSDGSGTKSRTTLRTVLADANAAKHPAGSVTLNIVWADANASMNGAMSIAPALPANANFLQFLGA